MRRCASLTWAVKLRSSSSECTPSGPSRSSSPCSTSTVARASASARWVGFVVVRKCTDSVASLQSGTSSRVSTRRASSAVSTTREPGHGRSKRLQAALRKPMSNGALWATSTASPTNSRNAGSTPSIGGAAATIASVMPVRTATYGGMPRRGSTSVANSPRIRPPRTLTAPISVISSPSAEPPVVSRSTTTKVTSQSGSSSSSNAACT